MSDPSRFLTSLAQAFATMGLYPNTHPSRARTLDAAYEQLLLLQSTDPQPQFSFLEHEVVYGRTTLQDMRDWAPGTRLSGIGVQRLEFTGFVSREDFELFVEDVMQRLALTASSAEARPERPTAIRFGAVGLRGETQQEENEPLQVAGINYTMGEEVSAIKWIHQEVASRGNLHLLEAEATVRSLSVAMHGESRIVIPLLELKEFDQYTTTHSMNVAVLAMALAEYLGLDARDVRTFGVAGLLHDLGKVRIPKEILNKPGKLTDEERQIMQRHPSDGARVLIDSDRQLDLAATVAYEHHIMIDGGGYPNMHFRRDCHAASKLVHVCDVYDALRTKRPYRGAWESPKVLSYLEERAGTEFDASIVRGFIAMMQAWDLRVTRTDAPEEAAWK
ncbi:MAG: HD domain-containing protein [Anaerolineae bacterium]|nr:HD domain-containing protein [Gemmatimonadaceae bacterium]